MMRKLLLFEN